MVFCSFSKMLLIAAFLLVCAQAIFASDQKTGKYGEPCSQSEQCDQSQGLKCTDESVCGCEEFFELVQSKEYVTWFGTKYEVVKERKVEAGTCSKLIGMICSEEQYSKNAVNSSACPRNAFCDMNNKECTCKNGFTTADDFGCGLSHGSSCNGQEIPGAKMTCDDGKVACRSPSYQAHQNGCKSLVGVVCTSDPDEIPCVAGASCKTSNITGDLRCHCMEGFVENEYSSCDVAYGGKCGYLSEEKRVVCSKAAGLKCKDGKCGCKNELDVYVEERGKCLAGIGYPCKENEDCVPNSKCELQGTAGKLKRCI